MYYRDMLGGLYAGDIKMVSLLPWFIRPELKKYNKAQQQKDAVHAVKSGAVGMVGASLAYEEETLAVRQAMARGINPSNFLSGVRVWTSFSTQPTGVDLELEEVEPLIPAPDASPFLMIGRTLLQAQDQAFIVRVLQHQATAKSDPKEVASNIVKYKAYREALAADPSSKTTFEAAKALRIVDQAMQFTDFKVAQFFSKDKGQWGYGVFKATIPLNGITTATDAFWKEMAAIRQPGQEATFSGIVRVPQEQQWCKDLIENLGSPELIGQERFLFESALAVFYGPNRQNYGALTEDLAKQKLTAFVNAVKSVRNIQFMAHYRSQEVRVSDDVRAAANYLSHRANTQALTHRALGIELQAARNELARAVAVPPEGQPEHITRTIYEQSLDTVERAMDKYYKQRGSVFREDDVRKIWAAVAILHDVARIVPAGNATITVAQRFQGLSWAALENNIKLFFPVGNDGKILSVAQGGLNRLKESYDAKDQTNFIRRLAELLETHPSTFYLVTGNGIKEAGISRSILDYDIFDNLKHALLVTNENQLNGFRRALGRDTNEIAATTKTLSRAEQGIAYAGNNNCLAVTNAREHLNTVLACMRDLAVIADPTGDANRAKFIELQERIIAQITTAADRFNNLVGLEGPIQAIKRASNVEDLREAARAKLQIIHDLYSGEVICAQAEVANNNREAQAFRLVGNEAHDFQEQQALRALISAQKSSGLNQTVPTTTHRHNQVRNVLNVACANIARADATLTQQATLLAVGAPTMTNNTIESKVSALVSTNPTGDQAAVVRASAEFLSAQADAERDGAGEALHAVFEQHRKDANGSTSLPHADTHKITDEAMCVALKEASTVTRSNLDQTYQHFRDLTEQSTASKIGTEIMVAAMARNSTNAAKGDIPDKAAELVAGINQIATITELAPRGPETGVFAGIFKAARVIRGKTASFFERTKTTPATTPSVAVESKQLVDAATGKTRTIMMVTSDTAQKPAEVTKGSLGLAYEAQLYRRASGYYQGGYKVGATVDAELRAAFTVPDGPGLPAGHEFVALEVQSKDETGQPIVTYAVGLLDRTTPDWPKLKAFNPAQEQVFNDWLKQPGSAFLSKLNEQQTRGNINLDVTAETQRTLTYAARV